jgi:hypothetical protein
LDPESKVVPQARSYCEMHVPVQGTGARSSAAQPASFSLNRGVCRKKKKKKKKKKRRKEERLNITRPLAESLAGSAIIARSEVDSGTAGRQLHSQSPTSKKSSRVAISLDAAGGPNVT